MTDTDTLLREAIEDITGREYGGWNPDVDVDDVKRKLAARGLQIIAWQKVEPGALYDFPFHIFTDGKRTENWAFIGATYVALITPPVLNKTGDA